MKMITMKTMNRIRVMMMAVLLVLLGTMQAAAVEYKNSYQRQGIMNSYSQPVLPIRAAMMPKAAFQSTSTMSFTTETVAGNTLNANGTVNTGAYGIGANHALGRPRRIDANDNGIDDDEEDGEDTGNAGTPGQTVEQKDQLPLGDAVLPLLMMSLAFCGYLYLRRKRSEA